jgi:UDP-N-acetyl-2-amino-2-deoxyglucuronate dehydrogenase
MTLRFAIVGCGKIAPRHAEEMIKHGTVVAVCDIVPERADKLASKFSATPYYDITSLLSNQKSIDLVAICTPNGLHTAHSINCLEAGSHVLCEKPLSISVTDAHAMIAASKKANRKLFVVKSGRYNPALIQLKELVDKNDLGKVYSFQLNCFWNRPPAYYSGSWRGTELDGGTLFTQFSHYIDALLWIFGDVKNISGFRKNSDHKDSILSEDNGVLSLEMQNGILGGLNWSVNSYQKNMEISLSILAENASIRIAGEYLNKLEYECSDKARLSIPGGVPNDYGSYKGSMSHHDKVYENLVKALENDGHPFTFAEDGLKTVELIERIYKSVPLC